jgi:hypothetical protein
MIQSTDKKFHFLKRDQKQIFSRNEIRAKHNLFASMGRHRVKNSSKRG